MPGLYIHVPFCVQKCRYCDFYSLPGQSKRRKAYIEAVLTEAAANAGMRFESLYLGGGTPSFLGGDFLRQLLDGLKSTFDLSHVSEATVEVNPDSASPEFLTAAKAGGLSRVSIGVQSLNDNELRAAGRIHTAAQALRTVESALQHDFTVSADLIAGLPGQSWDSLLRSLELLSISGVRHISLYCLSVEPGTPMANDPPESRPDDDSQAELFGRAAAFLKRQGFSHYEISNFAVTGDECRHNLNYWHGGEYLGLGPAAASHVDGRRFRNKADFDAYLSNPCRVREDIEQLTAPSKAAEEAMLRLRLLQDGLNIDTLAGKFGRDNTTPLLSRLRRMVTEGKLLAHGSTFCLPSSRVLTSNSIFAEVLA